jgi:hypothetical protein
MLFSCVARATQRDCLSDYFAGRAALRRAGTGGRFVSVTSALDP